MLCDLEIDLTETDLKVLGGESRCGESLSPEFRSSQDSPLDFSLTNSYRQANLQTNEGQFLTLFLNIDIELIFSPIGDVARDGYILAVYGYDVVKSVRKVGILRRCAVAAE